MIGRWARTHAGVRTVALAMLLATSLVGCAIDKDLEASTAQQLLALPEVALHYPSSTLVSDEMPRGAQVGFNEYGMGVNKVYSTSGSATAVLSWYQSQMRAGGLVLVGDFPNQTAEYRLKRGDREEDATVSIVGPATRTPGAIQYWWNVELTFPGQPALPVLTPCPSQQCSSPSAASTSPYPR